MRTTMRSSRKLFLTLRMIVFGLMLAAVMAFMPNRFLQVSAMETGTKEEQIHEHFEEASDIVAALLTLVFTGTFMQKVSAYAQDDLQSSNSIFSDKQSMYL